MTRLTRRTVLAGGIALAAPAWAASLFDPTPAEQDAALALLNTPGHALLLRHTLAPGHGDPADFSLRECQTQRNLDDVGREQAVKVGAWLRGKGIIPTTVYSSQWCRCLDTANLMGFKPIVEEVSLNSIADMPGTEASKLRKLRRFIGTLAAKPGPAILVTHSTIGTHLIGGLLGSGEGAVIRMQPDGSTVSVGRILFGMERV